MTTFTVRMSPIPFLIRKHELNGRDLYSGILINSFFSSLILENRGCVITLEVGQKLFNYKTIKGLHTLMFTVTYHYKSEMSLRMRTDF
ncbi:hypothetical protein OUZ56_019278 [Daphnia magna]|uniref:Uncharacterized protein n=1 Tax=Daphnia magna TaxID=35525 RepID=A0ABQ9ZB48_9CRUS|nr:hypothetical protein OUZ56_019278 [Daphnia magna]